MTLELLGTSTPLGSGDRGSQEYMLSPLFPACPLPDRFLFVCFISSGFCLFVSFRLKAKVCFPWWHVG